MNGKEFIVMQKQDLESYKGKDKPALLDVIALMECVVNTAPDADIDHNKCAKDCYDKMREQARKKSSQSYCFGPKESESFVREYLGLSGDCSKSNILQLTAKKQKVNLIDFF